MNLPPTHDLVTLFIGHIKNISTHIYSGLPNVDIFPYTILNITLINITTHFIRSLLIFRNCQTYSGRDKFSNILIFA